MNMVLLFSFGLVSFGTGISCIIAFSDGQKEIVKLLRLICLISILVTAYVGTATYIFLNKPMVFQPLTSVSAMTPDGSTIVHFGVDDEGSVFKFNGALVDGYSLVMKKRPGVWVIGIHCIHLENNSPEICAIPSVHESGRE